MIEPITLSNILTPEGENFWSDIFAVMDVTDAIIRKWQKRYPAQAAVLYDCFSLGKPTFPLLLESRRLWAYHFEELLQRVVDGEDLNPATDAELLAGLLDTSKVVPPHGSKFTLYFRLFKKLFPVEASKISADVTIYDYESSPGWVAEQTAIIRTRYSSERHQPSPARWNLLQERKAIRQPRLL